MRYYLINLEDGSYCGTDNEDTARDCAKRDSYLVVDKERDEVIDYENPSRSSPIPMV